MTNLGEKREDILRNKDGYINEEQLQKELRDFSSLMETLQAIIYNVFGLGKVYFWKLEDVDRLWKDREKEIIKGEVEGIILSDVEGMETKEEIIDYLKDYIK